MGYELKKKGKCIICNKQLVGRQLKHCCSKHKDKYYRQKYPKKMLAKVLSWQRRNPEKVAIINKRTYQKNKLNVYRLNYQSYQRNKSKWHSRRNTLYLLKGKSNDKKRLDLKKECKICKTKKDLQIHHEIYPTIREEIIKAIEKGKIFYLCIKHHHQYHKRRIRN